MTQKVSLESTTLKTPIGWLKVVASGDGITQIDFLASGKSKPTPIQNPHLLKAAKQLVEYFEGKRKDFDLPLQLEGTEFQIQVWKTLLKIPFGKTTSYGAIAEQIGKSKAVRAVGSANNRNRLPIVIPCHRVIGKSGDLVGYAGGLKLKTWLLTHEKQNPRLV